MHLFLIQEQRESIPKGTWILRDYQLALAKPKKCDFLSFHKRFIKCVLRSQCGSDLDMLEMIWDGWSWLRIGDITELYARNIFMLNILLFKITFQLIQHLKMSKCTFLLGFVLFSDISEIKISLGVNQSPYTGYFSPYVQVPTIGY